MDEHEQKAVDNIEEYGCHVMHIFAEDNLPRFTYSVGIYGKTKQPELIVMGLKREVAHTLVNDYSSFVKEGRVFNPGEYYSDFLDGYDVTFIEVAKEHYEEYFGWDIWYYKGKSFPVLQLVFPDKSGVWPWEERASEDFKWYQPLLNQCLPIGDGPRFKC
ncbi:MAG: DUF4262 domain-containing protein [Candidatus Thiodiazotropha sp. (ex Semelilucina semeliformis)]|nr:DUF4262 domain-containing protein [Candidatus Thiodiazotropha sp. (ex Semelilucina semeliformis)]